MKKAPACCPAPWAAVERGLRSGTESVPLIGALGEAVRLLPPAGESLEQVQKLNSLLRQELSQLPGVESSTPPRTPCPMC